MNEFLNAIAPLFTTHAVLAFSIIYVVTIFFGDIFAFTVFWLIFNLHLEEKYTLAALLVVLLSNITGDLVFYYAGRYLRDTRLGNLLKNNLPYHNRIERHVRENSRHWIFLSKFIYASTFTIIFMVGWTGVEFPLFIRTSLLSIASWVPLLFVLAYLLTWSFGSLGAVAAFKKIELVFLAGIVMFLFLHWLLGRVAERLSGEKD